ncbi:MAG: hypothetical protein EXS31_04720 [Pedosphaera sp.]|nr:hypothetical protein [Pedosphaera sp.]
MAPLFASLLMVVANGQESQFAFDPNGNLVNQTSAIVAPPEILSHPQPQVVVPHGLASFFVIAANTRGLGYQWRFNGTNINGATSDSLLLQNVGVTNEGPYSVVLVNSSGSVTSAPAALLLDGDRDGLPDSWELASFGNLNQNPTGDSDGDGVSNLDEFLEGTNPADSASVLFQLTVLSDGGQVTVNPSRFSFTNGEIVTLTATAIAPNRFHGWTGATNTSSPTISLVMTTNKTVAAYLGASYDIAWTNSVSGDWHAGLNWSPGIVPGTEDNVTISKSVTVTLNSNAECGNLILGGSGTAPALTGAGTLTVNGDALWIFGGMTGSGRTIISPGATLTIANVGPVGIATRTLENGGTVLWTGAGNFNMSSGVITNRAGALFETRGSGVFALTGGAPRFDNAGTFRKTVDTSTTSLASSIAFNNYGAVEIQTGTLSLGGGGSHSGTFDVSGDATLSFSGGTHTASAGSSITGDGNLTVNASVVTLAGLVNVSGTNTVSTASTANFTGNYICTNNTLVLSSGTANFNGTGTVSPAFVTLSGGTLSGNQVVAVLNQMNWPSGGMTGSGRTIISPGATLTIGNVSPVGITTRTLENGGTVLWTGTGNMNLSGATITNRPGALFETRGSGDFALTGGAPRFNNAGTFRKTVDKNTTSFGSGIAFNNYGTVEIRSGILAANGGYTSTANALLNCAIGGTTAGTGYGRLQVASTVTLNGALGVNLINGFVPTTNDTFTVLTAGTRNGTFASFSYPSNEFTMQLSNTANSVIVRVTGGGVVSQQPVFLPPEVSGTDIRLIWTGLPNTTYRLEFNPDLGLPNWIDLPGDVTSLGNTASKLDTLTSRHRFYRVRVVP